MVEHIHANEPVCPYCGARERDAWEINFGPGIDGDTTHTCGSCGEDYLLERIVDVSYSSHPIAKATEAANADQA